MLNKGWFVTFEGADGSGKTTASQQVFQRLKQLGYDVIYTREPGGSEIAEKIRQLILDPTHLALDAKAEALLYAASRRQHLVEVIIPALAQKQIVICDRFIDSSLAYQGYGREIPLAGILEINDFAIEQLYPMLTYWLDVPAEVGLKRIASRLHHDRLDQESVAFHQRVVAGYQAIAKLFPERIMRIDATQTPELIIEMIMQDLLEHINAVSA